MKIYVSHCIRSDTEEGIKKNIDDAQKLSRNLSKAFPEVEFYVPADHDEVIQILWKYNFINVEQILEADCEIIRGCDGMILWHREGISEGMARELHFALLKKVPILFTNMHNTAVDINSHYFELECFFTNP